MYFIHMCFNKNKQTRRFSNYFHKKKKNFHHRWDGFTSLQLNYTRGSKLKNLSNSKLNYLDSPFERIFRIQVVSVLLERIPKERKLHKEKKRNVRDTNVQTLPHTINLFRIYTLHITFQTPETKYTGKNFPHLTW